MLSGQTHSDTHTLHSIPVFVLSITQALLRRTGWGYFVRQLWRQKGSVTSPPAEKVHFFQHHCVLAVSSYRQSRCVVYDWTGYKRRYTSPSTETPCAAVNRSASGFPQVSQHTECELTSEMWELAGALIFIRPFKNQRKSEFKSPVLWQP